MVVRPLVGWATAWSFDRLRLWIEKGIDPELSMQRGLVHAVARLALAVIFLYQGLVPKLIYRHSSELAMLSDGGLGPEAAGRMLTAGGLAEVAFGLVLVMAWRVRWPFAVILILMPVALVAVSIAATSALAAAPTKWHCYLATFSGGATWRQPIRYGAVTLRARMYVTVAAMGSANHYEFAAGYSTR